MYIYLIFAGCMKKFGECNVCMNIGMINLNHVINLTKIIDYDNAHNFSRH